jgi:hypothetical protein
VAQTSQPIRAVTMRRPRSHIMDHQHFDAVCSLIGAASGGLPGEELMTTIDMSDGRPKEPRRLRELAAWYRVFAEEAGNPVIWEARLRTAADLEKEANRLEDLAPRRRALANAR